VRIGKVDGFLPAFYLDIAISLEVTGSRVTLLRMQVCICTYLSKFLRIYPSIHPSTFRPSVHPSVHQSPYLCTCMHPCIQVSLHYVIYVYTYACTSTDVALEMHGFNDNKKKTPCRHFLKGNCTLGYMLVFCNGGSFCTSVLVSPPPCSRPHTGAPSISRMGSTTCILQPSRPHQRVRLQQKPNCVGIL